MRSSEAKQVSSVNCNGLSYTAWKGRVDGYIENKCGLTADDLPDRNFWDSWNAGESPEDFARDMLEDEGMTDDTD